MRVLIYQPSKHAMQSGKAKTRKWVLQYESEQARFVDPLMGWTGSSDMNTQIKLFFDTKERAISYAKERAIPYQLIEETAKKPDYNKTYASNFSNQRKQSWTH